MRVDCEKCHATYTIDSARVRRTGTKVRCSRCNHVFTIYSVRFNDERDAFRSLFDSEQVSMEACLFREAVWGKLGEA